METPIDPRNFNREFTTRRRRAGVRVITVHDGSPDIRNAARQPGRPPSRRHEVLRHAKFSITMEINSKITSAQTRDARKRLGDSLGE